MVKKEYNGKVRVDAKIEAMIRTLTEYELNALEESLLAEGKSISPLWLWGDLLVDGHNRFRLCKKYKLPYEVKQAYEDAEDMDDVMDRIRRDSLARRNLSTGEQSKHRAERVSYKIKKSVDPSEAIRAVAKESNVSVRQVQRDVKRAGLIETLDEDVKTIAVAVSTPVVKKLASLSKEKQKAVVKKAGGNAKAIEKEVKKDTPEKAVIKDDTPQALVAPIQAVATQLNGMLKELKRLADYAGGEWLDLTDLETQITALKYSIRQSVYWVDCMDCSGKGCKTCHKHGWLSLDRKKHLTQEQKDKVGV